MTMADDHRNGLKKVAVHLRLMVNIMNIIGMNIMVLENLKSRKRRCPEMIVKLNKNKAYQNINPNNIYFVIGIEADYYRILNDLGEPYLYPPNIFKIIDKTEPEDWDTEYGEDGERYSYPIILNQVGFFEDYFDGKENSISIFWNIINQKLAKAA